MKKGLLILLLLLVTSFPVLAAPTNTTGPWGIDVNPGAFTSFSTAKRSPVTLDKTMVLSKVTNVNTLTVSDRSIDIKRGGGFTIASGKVLTIPTPKAGRYQIFYGPGSVLFTDGGSAYPEWWGAYSNGTHATETTAGITKAITATTTVDFGEGNTFLTSGNALKSNLRLRGASTLKFNDAGGPGIFYNTNSDLSNVYIEGLQFDVTGITYLGSASQYPRVIKLTNIGNAYAVFNITISDCKFIGLKIDAIFSNGGGREYFVSRCQFFGDVSDGAMTLADGVRVETDPATVPYGTIIHKNINVTDCYSYGVRTLVDYKRGTGGSVANNNIAINSTDVAYSFDNSFNLIANGNYAENFASFYTYAGAENKHGFEIQGENIIVSNNQLRGGGNATGRGIMITQYGNPFDTPQFHSSVNVKIIGNIVDGFYQGIRLQDTINCQVLSNTVTNTTAQRITLEHPAESTMLYPSGNVVKDNITNGGTAYSVDSTSIWSGNDPTLQSSGTFQGKTNNRLLFSNPHLSITTGAINVTTGGEAVVAGASIPSDINVYQSAKIQDTSGAGLAQITLASKYRQPTIFVGLWSKLITATGSGVIFQEFTSGDVFIKATFVDLSSTTSWTFQSIGYTKTDPTWAYTKIQLMPATSWNDPTATGTTEIAGLIVSDTFTGTGSTQNMAGI